MTESKGLKYEELALISWDESVELSKKDVLEALGLKENEFFEVNQNLLGAFGTLQKIQSRLIKEGKARVVNGEVLYD